MYTCNIEGLTVAKHLKYNSIICWNSFLKSKFLLHVPPTDMFKLHNKEKWPHFIRVDGFYHDQINKVTVHLCPAYWSHNQVFIFIHRRNTHYTIAKKGKTKKKTKKCIITWRKMRRLQRNVKLKVSSCLWTHKLCMDSSQKHQCTESWQSSWPHSRSMMH